MINRRSIIEKIGESRPKKKAYIDIETDYIGKFRDIRLFRDYKNHLLAIVGIYVVQGKNEEIIQLVGEECTKNNILRALDGIDVLITYNGRSKRDSIYGRTGFDFPVIHAQTGIMLDRIFNHIDLVPLCWEKGLTGGLKIVEKRLKIERKIKDIDGKKAMEMWRLYQKNKNKELLKALLDYNKEDIINLRIIEQRLFSYKPVWNIKLLLIILFIGLASTVANPFLGLLILLGGILTAAPKGWGIRFGKQIREFRKSKNE